MPTTVQRLIGVYDADHTLRGELSYFVNARLGRTHCALCEITHGLLKEKADWQQCRAELPVAFETFHRDDQPDAVRAASDDAAPVVLAELDGGELRVLLDGPALEECAGSVDQMQQAVEEAIAAEQLVWPAA